MMRPRVSVFAPAEKDPCSEFGRRSKSRASAARVYAFVSRPENLPSFWPSMVEVSNVARRDDGSHDFDWVYKMAGVHFKGHSASGEAQPGRLLRDRSVGGISSSWRWTFEGLDGTGCKLTVETEYSIPTPVLGKLAEALVARTNEREMEHTLANLRDVMEGTASTAPQAQAPH